MFQSNVSFKIPNELKFSHKRTLNQTLPKQQKILKKVKAFSCLELFL